MLRVGIIGMGFGAAVHLPVFTALADVAVTAIADGGSGRAREVAASLPHVVAVVQDPMGLIERSDVDAVSIAVPPRAQAALVVRAIEAGKAILCEKPLGQDLATTSDLAARAASYARVTAVSFSYRYDPGICALRRELSRGSIGKVERIDVAWFVSGGLRPDRLWDWRNDGSAGGGVVAEFCIHVIDYLRWLTGSEVENVIAATGIRVPERQSAAGGPQRVTAPDFAELLLQMRGGIRASVLVSNTYRTGLGHRIEITGTLGRLTLQHRPPFTAEARSLTMEKGGRSEVVPVDPSDPTMASGGDSRKGAFHGLATAFVGAVRGEGRHTPPTFGDALAARRIVAAAELGANSTRSF